MHESNIDKVIPASKTQGEDKQKLFQRVHEQHGGETRMPFITYIVQSMY